jgi:membrane protein YqaA with SNARE-associated domain
MAKQAKDPKGLPMFRRLYDWTLRWSASRHAPTALGVISFTESSCFPIPADVLYIPMVLARPDRAYRLAFLASVTSVLGGIFGWAIGYYAFSILAQPLLELYGKMEAFNALRDATGTWTILLLLVTSGFSHLPPMKVVTILSGVVSFSLPLFILSAIVARGGRFYLLAYALKHYGNPVVDFIERRFLQVTLGVLALGAAVWVWHFGLGG